MLNKVNKLKFFGRYSIRDGNYTFYNGGSGLSFKMKGNSFSIKLELVPAPGYIYVILDKNYDKKTKILVKNPIFNYSFNDNKEHFVDILKANEANDNALVISSLDIDGELLDYDFNHKYKIKVYGDSTIAGFGILAHDGDASIHVSDSIRDFCFHGLYELGYDYDIFSASGWGLVFSDYTNPKEIGIINYKDKVKVCSDIKFVDDRKADLLIVSLGTNDYSYVAVKDSLNRVNIFKKTYKELIDSELSKNPDLKILMVYGTLKEKDVYPMIEATYEYLKPLYKNLFIHKFDGDNTAISNHAYVDKHDIMARELIEVINQIMDKEKED